MLISQQPGLRIVIRFFPWLRGCLDFIIKVILTSSSSVTRPRRIQKSDGGHQESWWGSCHVRPHVIYRFGILVTKGIHPCHFWLHGPQEPILQGSRSQIWMTPGSIRNMSGTIRNMSGNIRNIQTRPLPLVDLYPWWTIPVERAECWPYAVLFLCKDTGFFGFAHFKTMNFSTMDWNV